MNDPRWCVVMNNLLYPAVLGTLIYTGFNHLSGNAIGVLVKEAGKSPTKARARRVRA